MSVLLLVAAAYQLRYSMTERGDAWGILFCLASIPTAMLDWCIAMNLLGYIK